MSSATPQPGLNLPSDEEIRRRAEERVAAMFAALTAPIESARARAARQALAEQESIRGFGRAGAELMRGIGPGMQEGYHRAAQSIVDYGGGFAGASADRLRAGMRTNRATVDALAPGSAPSAAPNADDVQNALHGLGAVIPGSSLEEQGAHARRWGEALPAIEHFRTEESLRQARGKASEQDKEYEEKLLDLAARKPELTNQIMDELYDRELQRLNARLGVEQFEEQKRHTRVEERQSGRQIGVQERAQNLYEREFGLKKQKQRHDIWVDRQSLRLQNAKQRADVIQALNEGAQPNASLSKTYGYIVDSYGNPILDRNGKKIKVAQTPAQKKEGQQQKNEAYRGAVNEARTLRGDAVAVSDDQATLGAPGRYVARPGVKGVFPGKPGVYPPTTNNPRLAQRENDMSFAEALAYLTEAYGITRAQARKALVAAGWRPDGQRPKPKPPQRRSGR